MVADEDGAKSMSPLIRRGVGAAAMLLALCGCAGGPVAYDAAGNPTVGTPPYGAPGIVPSAAPAASIAAATPAGVPFGYQCFAGFYQCRLAASVPVGSSCSCPGLGGPSYGVVR